MREKLPYQSKHHLEDENWEGLAYTSYRNPFLLGRDDVTLPANLQSVSAYMNDREFFIEYAQKIRRAIAAQAEGLYPETTFILTSRVAQTSAF